MILPSPPPPLIGICGGIIVPFHTLLAMADSLSVPTKNPKTINSPKILHPPPPASPPPNLDDI